MTDQNITGRDSYIIKKALHWALEHAMTRPDSEREHSDEQDMRAILARISSPTDPIPGVDFIAELNKPAA